MPILQSQKTDSEYYINTNAGCAIAEVLEAIDKRAEKRRKAGGL